jgi:ABC-2 type transport system permease protein
MAYSRIRFIITFAWFYGYTSLKRGYVYVATYMITPLSVLFLIYVISRGALLPYAILGGLLSIITMNSLSLVADVTFLRLELKLQDLLISTHVKALDYLIGHILSNLIFSMPGIMVYILLGTLYGMFNAFRIIWLILVLTPLLISSSALAFFISTFIPHVRHSWGVASFLSIVFTIIPPLYYPAYAIPVIFLYPLLISPSTPASLVLQSAFGLYETDIILNYVTLIVETSIYVLLALKFSRWRSV